MADSSLERLDAAAILPKPVRPSDLFNALVSIASEGSPHHFKPHFMRRRLRPDRPNFAARVLVAEDNPVNQEVATGMLETMGCRVVSAPNGRAAFRLYAQEKFDAVLMDCEMPIMDGIEATRRIREIEAMAQGLPDGSPGRQRTPIIALTAHALGEVRETCLAAGMDDFLVKPFDDRQLAATLLRWLVPVGTHGDVATRTPMPARHRCEQHRSRTPPSTRGDRRPARARSQRWPVAAGARGVALRGDRARRLLRPCARTARRATPRRCGGRRTA